MLVTYQSFQYKNEQSCHLYRLQTELRFLFPAHQIKLALKKSVDQLNYLLLAQLLRICKFLSLLVNEMQHEVIHYLHAPIKRDLIPELHFIQPRFSLLLISKQ